MDLDVQHDIVARKFVVDLNGEEAYVAYAPTGDRRLDFRSTFVPPAHRHQGIGEQLVKHALDHARQSEYEVIPTCPFVRRVVERNPEYQEVTIG